MSIYDSLLPNLTHQKIPISQRIHEKVLCQYSWAERLPKNLEVLFPVSISVSCVVGADYLVLEDLLRSFIEAVSESV